MRRAMRSNVSSARQQNLAVLTDHEARDALERIEIADPITQRALHHGDEQRRSQTFGPDKEFAQKMVSLDAATRGQDQIEIVLYRGRDGAQPLLFLLRGLPAILRLACLGLLLREHL